RHRQPASKTPLSRRKFPVPRPTPLPRPRITDAHYYQKNSQKAPDNLEHRYAPKVQMRVQQQRERQNYPNNLRNRDVNSHKALEILLRLLLHAGLLLHIQVQPQRPPNPLQRFAGSHTIHDAMADGKVHTQVDSVLQARRDGLQVLEVAGGVACHVAEGAVLGLGEDGDDEGVQVGDCARGGLVLDVAGDGGVHGVGALELGEALLDHEGHRVVLRLGGGGGRGAGGVGH
ncbi:uncharacterized protein BDZ99DRAFT_560168, partial [Mytilinidion resinicola]